MLLAVLVVGRATLLQNLAQFGDGERLFRTDIEQGFGQGQQIAAVAVGHADQGPTRLRLQRQDAALSLLGLGQQGFLRRRVQVLEHIDLAAGQQGAVELEGRVLGGRPHQGHGPLLHERQETILLGAVETVDLVDEQQGRPAAGPAGSGGVERLAQISDP